MLDFLVYAVSVGTETAGQGEKKILLVLELASSSGFLYA